ncbi:hypothetical protein RKE40_29460, partial [Bosea sp. ZW T0_25]|nr:hypothetical protein [Bosea sp. ZW T0_25]
FRWRVSDQSDPEPISTSILQPSVQAPRMIDRLKSHWLVSSAGALVIGLFVAVIALVASLPPAVPMGQARPSLLVKPFVNLTGRAEVQMFAAELEDEIVTQLAPNEEIMISRSEPSAAFALSTASAHSQSRRRLLEGTIRASEGKLRVTSRLIDSETAAIIWSGIYEADLRVSRGFDMETEIAARIVSDVRLRLRPAMVRR